MHEVVYENLLLSRRSELHERAAGRSSAPWARSPSRLSDLEALGHHWSFTADRRKGARYLVAAGDRARAVYANEDAIRHYERALAHARRLPGLRRPGASRARTARRPFRAHRTARRCAGALRGRAREELEAASDRGRRRASASQDRRAALGGRRTRARQRLLRGRPRTARRGRRTRSSVRTSTRRSAGWPSVPATTPTPSPGPSGRLPKRREEHAELDTERARETAVTRAQAYNTLGVALARTGRLDEAVAQIEQSIALAESHDLLQATCRGYTNLGVLYSSLDPQRSIETCLRGLEIAKKVGDLGFQSRLYANLAVAYCALTDRCEAEGIEAARNGDRSRSSAGAARPPRGAPDRAWTDPPMSRRSRAGARLLPGGAGACRAGRRAAAPLPLLRRPCYALSRCRRRRHWPRSTWRRPRKSASGPGSSPTRSLVLPFLC